MLFRSAGEWSNLGGDAGSTRYSPLSQLTPQNLGALRIAWRRPAVASEFAASHPEVRSGNLRSTPLVVGGVMYLTVDQLTEVSHQEHGPIVLDPSNASHLAVGTDLGVFETFDGGTTWTQQNSGLANVSVVDLERSGRLHTLVTQNIDGLHQAAGSDPERVVEIHRGAGEVFDDEAGHGGREGEDLARIVELGEAHHQCRDQRCTGDPPVPDDVEETFGVEPVVNDQRVAAVQCGAQDARPEGALESAVFAQLLTHAWNLRRVSNAESRLIAETDPIGGPEEAFPKLERFARYRRDLERSFYRALAELRQLQTQRAALLQQPDHVIEAFYASVPLADLTRLTRHTDHLPNAILLKLLSSTPHPGLGRPQGSHDYFR